MTIEVNGIKFDIREKDNGIVLSFRHRVNFFTAGKGLKPVRINEAHLIQITDYIKDEIDSKSEAVF